MKRQKRIVVPWSAIGCCCLLAVGCQLGPQTAPDVAPEFLASKSPVSQAKEPPAEEMRAGSSVTLASARALEQQGELKQAATSYRKLASDKATSSQAWHRLAVISDRMGNHEQAAGYYQQALQANDADPELLCDYGYSCYLQGQLAKAEVQLRQALRCQPELARAQNNLGLVLAQMGRRDEAIQLFAAAGCTAKETELNVALATSEDLSPNAERVFNELAQQARQASGLDVSHVNRVSHHQRK